MIRYEIDLIYDFHGNPSNFKVNPKEGEWVRWKDAESEVKSLTDEIKRLEVDLRRAEQAIIEAGGWL